MKTGQIDGLAHITGGGLSENIIRILDDSLGIHIDTSTWTQPPVFQWLQEAGGISDEEMRRTFNCGIGMVAIVSSDNAERARESMNDSGVECFEIGEVTQTGESGRVGFV